MARGLGFFPGYLVFIREYCLRLKSISRILGLHSLQLLVLDSDFTHSLRLRDDCHQVIALSQLRCFGCDDIHVVIAVRDDDRCDDFVACFLDKVDVEFQ